MNFTIGTAAQGWRSHRVRQAIQCWKSPRVRQAIQLAATGSVLASAALLAGGVFERSSPAPSAGTVEGPPIAAPVESRVAGALVYFLVDTEAEAARLEGANASEQALLEPERAAPRFVYVAADSPAGIRTAEELASGAMASELGPNIEVVDLRSSAVRPAQPGVATPAIGPDLGTGAGASIRHHEAVYVLVKSEAKASLMQATIGGEALLLDAGPPANVSYSFVVADSAEAEKSAAELLATAGRELAAAGVEFAVVDMRDQP